MVFICCEFKLKKNVVIVYIYLILLAEFFSLFHSLVSFLFEVLNFQYSIDKYNLSVIISFFSIILFVIFPKYFIYFLSNLCEWVMNDDL